MIDDPRAIANAIAVTKTLSEVRFLVTSERLLQISLGRLWEDTGYEYEAEVALTARDRIDFLLFGNMGIEVKVKGSAANVRRQLARYAESPRVASLFLITTKSNHCNLPRVLNGKKVSVYQLVNSAL